MADRPIPYIAETGEIITIAWASALPSVGQRPIDQGVYPPGYRLGTFRYQDALNAMRRNAVDIGSAH